MKKLAIVIFLLTILTGCHSTERQANVDVVHNSTSAQTTVFESIGTTLFTPSNTQAPNQTITPATGSAWMEAYAKAITDVDSKPRHIRLLDVDFDGVPEIFLSYLGTSNSCIYHGFSFKSGKLFDVLIPEEFLPTTIELYQNKNTNELLWITNGMFRDGYGCYDYVWYKVDFSDFSDVKKNFFFGWNESQSTKSDAKEGDVVYTLIDANENDIETSKQEIENTKSKVFSNYEIIETLDLFSFVNDFMNGDENSLTEENINKDLFYTFLNLYEIKSHSNPVDNLSYPLNLPVYSIYNYNTYSHSQTTSEPISLVLEGYRRINEDTQTNVKVEYIQISRLNNPAVQTKINEILKNNVFDRVTEDTSKGLEYEVFSSAYIVGKMLSVSERSSFYQTDAVHPWQNMNAYAFNYVTGEVVTLSDIIAIDYRLKVKMLAGKFKCDRFSHEECIEWGTYDELYDAMMDDYLTGGRQSFYFTDYNLGFVLGTSHAGGDYWTFEIPFSDIEELFKPTLSAILKPQL